MEKQLAECRQELVMAIGKKLCKSEATKLLSRKMDTSTSSVFVLDAVDNETY